MPSALAIVTPYLLAFVGGEAYMHRTRFGIGRACAFFGAMGIALIAVSFASVNLWLALYEPGVDGYSWFILFAALAAVTGFLAALLAAIVAWARRLKLALAPSVSGSNSMLAITTLTLGSIARYPSINRM